ncbi:MAG: choice-of-anchor B family protein [Candidatus Yanofskybacteria bacterium]|nr:choice-of-anchor B family protein [Candidatus Yanofskybacteria bacterium]
MSHLTLAPFLFVALVLNSCVTRSSEVSSELTAETTEEMASDLNGLKAYLDMLGTESKSNFPGGLEIHLHPDLDQYGPFSHVCKMQDDTRYYAVQGTQSGTVFFNYTDIETQFFPGAPSHWRECRSYNHLSGNTYAYVVTEGDREKDKPVFTPEYPGGIQIFKLEKDGVKLVNTYVGNFNSAHTIFIDTERGLAFVNGSNWRGDVLEHHQEHKNHLGGLQILDLATDPEKPRYLGSYSASYTHDSYALGEVDISGRKAYIVYLADIFGGYIRVLDVSDPGKPVLLHSVHAPMHNQGYSVHNVWASEDKQWLFATEETEGSSLLVYDISNPVKPRFVSAYRNELVADDSIIHNVVIKGKIAYCSWYKEGVRLIDISNPVHPKEVAFFDSSFKDFGNSPFHGNWSVDVDDRGLVMISDIEEGLFILRRIQ